MYVLPIKQESNTWCGPAVTEAILRYFGFKENLTSIDYQTFLVAKMHTDSVSGTSVLKLINTINEIIYNNKLNVNKQYSLFNIGEHNSYINDVFYNIVSFSLTNNTPVVFLYHGSNNEQELDHSHYILITDVTTDFNNPVYKYMNPWTGQYDTFNNNNLESYLSPILRGTPRRGSLQINNCLLDFLQTHLIFSLILSF